MAVMSRSLTGISAVRYRTAISNVLGPVSDRYSSQALTSAGLVIKAGGGILAKTGAAVFYAMANGTLLSLPAATDMPSLTGLVIGATRYNVACFFVDAAGALTTAFGTDGAALGGVIFPPFPRGKALVGFLLVTHSATFTGGTTPLDTATTVYISPVGPFDPGVLV